MTTDTLTNAEIATDALRLAGVSAVDEAATSYDMEQALRTLSRMLKAWQNQGFNQWAIASQSVALTTASSYTMSPVRPVQILNVNFKDGDTETPMERMTRGEYDELPNKSLTGTPTQWYYDKQREAAKLYVWPALSTAAGETLEITYIRELADIVSATAVDVPSEWYEATVYGLAERLQRLYRTNRPELAAFARDYLDDALAMDRDESVFFAGPYAD